ncbi:MAG: TetR/AcrR family transcriptional regulator [Anaerolineae bacterium]|nr:TetR/AcrR family transcriptional regulator [Anaerolineae bacterium]
MGRKSLEKIRTQQLLDAFIACIPENGVDGTSLEKIAEKAGVTRSIIRHYIGNREVLIAELIDHIIQTSLVEFDQILNDPQKSMEERLNIALFAPRDNWQTDKIILNELVNAKEQSPAIQKRIAGLFETMLDRLTITLHKEMPQRSREAAQELAYILFCISMSQDTMVWMGISPSTTRYGPSFANQLIHTYLGAP